MSSIDFFFLLPVHSLKKRRSLRIFLQHTAEEYGRTLEQLTVVFCNDDYLLSINQQFLAHDYFTDIITFDLSPTPTGPIEAELYISVDRVRENAHTLGIPLYRELHRVVFHGLLHLLGFTDKNEKAKQRMRAKEDALLFQYFQGKR